MLRDLSLCVEPGTLFGLIGPSDSGKTTTFQLCCGHLRPSAGELTVLGEIHALLGLRPPAAGLSATAVCAAISAYAEIAESASQVECAYQVVPKYG